MMGRPDSFDTVPSCRTCSHAVSCHASHVETAPIYCNYDGGFWHADEAWRHDSVVTRHDHCGSYACSFSTFPTNMPTGNWRPDDGKLNLPKTTQGRGAWCFDFNKGVDDEA